MWPVKPTSRVRSASPSGTANRFSENASWHHGVFVTDQWQIGTRLTANVGLRWDYYSSYFPEQNIMDGPYPRLFLRGRGPSDP